MEYETRIDRAVLLALSGLILSVFVALISSTVVAPALPQIVTQLGGTQAAFTWIITATLLAMTVSTPIWGKLADLLDPKLLVQLALITYTLGSIMAGFAQSPAWLIACRAIQGVGVGGLMSLVQIVIATLISPRERGKYMGIMGAVMGAGQIMGPLLGGLITDTIGWRWTFWVFVPIAGVALVLIQATLKLPPRPPRQVRIDYLGAMLLATGVCLVLIWVTVVGDWFALWSPTSLLMLGTGALALALAVPVERRAPEPILPLRLFSDRTFVLAVVASIGVGIALFGTSVFISQYLQFARGASPTDAGVMMLPMVSGQMIGGIAIGWLITTQGRWKRYLVSGAGSLVLGLLLMGMVHYDTAFTLVGIFMVLIGFGMGVILQNTVLVVQNSVAAADLGAASSGVTFFRSFGGAMGVSAMGALLAHRVPDHISAGISDLAADGTLNPAELAAAREHVGGGEFVDLESLSEPLRIVVEKAYASGIAEIFLAASPIAVGAWIAIIALPNKRLSRKTGSERLVAEAENVAAELGEALTGSSTIDD